MNEMAQDILLKRTEYLTSNENPNLAWGARGRLFESDHPEQFQVETQLSYYQIIGFFVVP